MTSAEQLHGDESVMQQNTICAQSNLQVTAEKQTRKQSEQKEKTSPTSLFNLKPLAASITMGLLLGILLMLWLLLRRKYTSTHY